MPIKGQSPKQVIHTELHKFKHGKLHSGSSKGPLVKSRKQAIAIALSESRKARARGGSVKRRADGGSVGDDYNTQLNPAEEQAFQAWKRLNAPRDSGADYDLRGAFQAGFSRDPVSGHFDDTFKKPNHPTFSVYSKYAKDRPDVAGSWYGDQYIPAMGGAYARGGSVDSNDPSHGGTVPKARQNFMEAPPESWTRGMTAPPYRGLPSSKDIDDIKYADGGAADDLPDVGPPAIGGGGQFSPGTRLGNEAAYIGSELGGNAVNRAATLPWRYVKAMVDASRTQPGSEEAHQAYGDVGSATGEVGMSMLGPRGGTPMPNTSGAFVGPYAALALRNMAKETGNTAAERALVHPVVGKEIEHEVAAMPEWMRDAYRNSVQEDRDRWAYKTLTERAAKGDFNDRDVFARSGWSFTADGKPTKEISDVGAKLAPVEGGYRLQHPAGDLHKVYDLPTITTGNTPGGAQAYFRAEPMGIGVSKPNTGDALHEIQHAISYREGWPRGSNPIRVPQSVLERESFKGHDIPQYQRDILLKSGITDEATLDKIKSNPVAAQYAAYLHSAGENQAFNTANRLAHSFNYLKHPEDTEIVPRAFQFKEYNPKSTKEKDKFASGGRMGGFNPERAASIGLARQGMIHSQVPGRTDKINMNVPTGSYIVPADITSALGQGNSMAGSGVLDRMFNKGPYGMNLAKTKGGSPKTHARMSSLSKIKFADGGDAPAAPIVAAGGEYVVTPDALAHLGNGDIGLAHDIMDAFVKHVRDKNIKTLKGLKPPKGSKDAKSK